VFRLIIEGANMAKMIDHDKIVNGYEGVKPVNGYVLCEITDKPSERRLKSGIIVQEEVMSNDRPYLVVVSLSKEAQTKFPDLVAGDIVEVVDAGGKISYFYNNTEEMEKMALFDIKYLAAYYKKKV
jgi:hypothetical protein